MNAIEKITALQGAVEDMSRTLADNGGILINWGKFKSHLDEIINEPLTKVTDPREWAEFCLYHGKDMNLIIDDLVYEYDMKPSEAIEFIKDVEYDYNRG